MTHTTALLLTTLIATLSVGAVAQNTGAEGGTGTGTGSDIRTDRETGTGSGTTSQDDRDTTTFDDLDINRDERIDEDEARRGGFSREFRAIDRDGARSIDRDQFDQYRNRGRQQDQD